MMNILALVFFSTAVISGGMIAYDRSRVNNDVDGEKSKKKNKNKDGKPNSEAYDKLISILSASVKEQNVIPMSFVEWLDSNYSYKRAAVEEIMQFRSKDDDPQLQAKLERTSSFELDSIIIEIDKSNPSYYLAFNGNSSMFDIKRRYSDYCKHTSYQIITTGILSSVEDNRYDVGNTATRLDEFIHKTREGYEIQAEFSAYFIDICGVYYNEFISELSDDYSNITESQTEFIKELVVKSVEGYAIIKKAEYEKKLEEEKIAKEVAEKRTKDAYSIDSYAHNEHLKALKEQYEK